jgi:peptidoglycan/LPS O-acetylase OafA/YrhL
MIQRIQSIFFFLAALALAALFTFPMATTPDASGEGIFADAEYTSGDLPFLMILTGIGILVALVALFTFRNRPLQMRMGYLVIVMSILIPALAYWLYMQDAAGMPADVEVHDGFGLYLPFIALVCAIVANYFVRKDEKLVRSMDRLR